MNIMLKKIRKQNRIFFLEGEDNGLPCHCYATASVNTHGHLYLQASLAYMTTPHQLMLVGKGLLRTR